MPELKPNHERSQDYRLCQCSACRLFFGSVYYFDRHRVGRHEPYERRCLTPDELVAIGLEDRNGVWKKPAPVGASWRQVKEKV